MQWQEGDVTDMWNDPETDISRKRMTYVVDERIARGLTPAYVPWETQFRFMTYKRIDLCLS